MTDVKNKIQNIILVMVAIILIFNIVSITAPDIHSAAQNMSGGSNTSGAGLPFQSFFAPSGIMILVYMAMVMLSVFVIVKFK